MASQTIENYLKAIFTLMNPDGEVNLSDVAQSLDVSMPTVNSMVKKLADLDYIEYAKYKPLKITSKGKKLAAIIIRKHRLTEMFLVEKMGFGWEEVHEVAEQVEHIQSEIFFDRMDSLLGFPKYDPHGSPIPDKKGKIPSQNLKKLLDCKSGQEVILKEITDDNDGFLKLLNQRKLALGTQIKIIAVEPFDLSFTVSYAEFSEVVLSEKVCKKLMVALI